MPRALTSLCLLPLLALGHWALDFDEDFAAATAGKKAKLPYITDGLIAMWDGEWNAGFKAHDPGATTWKDLVGDADIILNDGKSWIVNSNNIEIDGSQSSIGSLANSVPDGRAVEVILYDKTELHRFPTLVCFNSGGFRVVVSSGDNRGLNFKSKSLSAAKVESIRDRATAVSVNLDADLAAQATYENGEYLGTFSPIVNFADTKPGFVLSTYTTDSRFRGNVYCIRVYNRNLSAEEIAQNHAIDKARFGL